jgi:hypothetical protein
LADPAYSRPRIAKEFRINEKTLSWLERTGRVNIEWRADNGLLVADLSEDTQRVLRCASAAIPALKVPEGVTLLPFQRFLHLRFLQLSIDDIYQELQDRNLINPNVFPLSQLETLRELFISGLPLLVQRLMRTGMRPETEEEKLEFATVLDVCELAIAYQHPELEQAFKFMTEGPVKDCLDCALSTKATLVEVQTFLRELADFPISIEGLAFYQSLFHDIALVPPEQFKKYLKLLKPSLRPKMMLAVNCTMEDFRLKSGYERDFEVDQVLNAFKGALTDNLISLINTKTPDSERAFHYTLRSLMMVIDRLEKAGTKGKAAETKLLGAPDIMRSIQLEPQEMSRMGIFRNIAGTEVNVNTN